MLLQIQTALQSTARHPGLRLYHGVLLLALILPEEPGGLHVESSHPRPCMLYAGLTFCYSAYRDSTRRYLAGI